LLMAAYGCWLWFYFSMGGWEIAIGLLRFL
jgi:hypothetical protein